MRVDLACPWDGTTVHWGMQNVPVLATACGTCGARCWVTHERNPSDGWPDLWMSVMGSRWPPNTPPSPEALEKAVEYQTQPLPIREASIPEADRVWRAVWARKRVQAT